MSKNTVQGNNNGKKKMVHKKTVSKAEFLDKSYAMLGHSLKDFQ